jgi:hypothetical protein
MPWVRFDDQYPIHHKVEELSDAAFRLNTAAVCWCSRNTTDGHVGERKPILIQPRARNINKVVEELVQAGLWKAAPGGWIIHDYLEYQPTKERVMSDRKASAERQKRHRDKHVTNTVTNTVSHGVTPPVSHSTPSRPVPTKATSNEVPLAQTRTKPPQKLSTSDQRVQQAQALKALYNRTPPNRELDT